MEPRLASRVVVFGIDRFVVDVRKVATQPPDLLDEPVLSIGHQLAIALIPQLVTMRQRPWDAAAVGLDGVFAYEVRLERWQFPMPKYDLRFVVIHGGSHKSVSIEDDGRATRKRWRSSEQSEAPPRNRTAHSHALPPDDCSSHANASTASRPMNVTGCIHDTYPMMAPCTMIHPRTIVPAMKALRPREPKPGEDDERTKSEVPPTTTDKISALGVNGTDGPRSRPYSGSSRVPGSWLEG